MVDIKENKLKKNISVSILNSKNIESFLLKLQKIKNELTKDIKQSEDDKLFDTHIHFDVMDNKFVPNLGIDLKYIVDAKKIGFYADTHLMVQKPLQDEYIFNAIEYGSDSITIHYEIDDFEKTLDFLNSEKDRLYKDSKRILDIGISVKPNTDIKLLEKYRDKFSKLLIMTVEPGFGGQAFIEEINSKIEEARKIFLNYEIQVDGGINDDTIGIPLKLGVNSFVIGSYLTNNENNIELLKDKIIQLNIIKSMWTQIKVRDDDFDKRILQIIPGGYGEKDVLLGIPVPKSRKLSNVWCKYLSKDIIKYYITSKYHEYRQFAIFCLSNKMKKLSKNDENERSLIYNFIKENLPHINNWDLTDETAPNIVGIYLINLDKNKLEHELNEYLNSSNTWIKRIGIVSQLTLIRKGEYNIPINVCKKVLYENNLLLQKATGWVLREIYKRDNERIVKFLKENNSKRKIPSIILSYACEKMSKEEKSYVRE